QGRNKKLVFKLIYDINKPNGLSAISSSRTTRLRITTGDRPLKCLVKKRFSKHWLPVLIATLSSPMAFANTSPALEEMLVTAQKRVQSLRDVPVSVIALNAEKIVSTGLTNVEKLADYIPSFNMTQTAIG